MTNKLSYFGLHDNRGHTAMMELRILPEYHIWTFPNGAGILPGKRVADTVGDFFRLQPLYFSVLPVQMLPYQPLRSTSISSITFLYTRSFFAYMERLFRFFWGSFA